MARMPGPLIEQSVLLARIATAAVQATALYLLTAAAEWPLSWPATEPRLFEPLLLVSVFAPLVLLFGLGTLRPKPLALWALAVALVVAALGYHDAVRGRVGEYPGGDVFWPLARLWLALAAGLFIAHVLVVDGAAARSLRPPYERHFDTAWRLGIQVILAAAFVGIFWVILFLGAGLFSLVDIAFFERLIEQRWFYLPATTLALAVSLHVTDVQPSLIRGVRTLALPLFSWLLPLLVVILLGFLVSLPLVSLEPLWNTRSPATLLLAAAALLVFLVNSSYQDGDAEWTASRIRRYAVVLGALELLPLTGLAAWALWLRVGQYGWTVERILAAAVVLLVASYALGYALAVLRSPSRMKGIESANVATAYLALVLLLALFTPLADPARLMVASQLARLESGAVPVERFDFEALKLDGARWGEAALTELSRRQDGPDAATIRKRAGQAVAAGSRFAGPPTAPPRDELASRITIYPEGQTLPDSFYDALDSTRGTGFVPLCLRGPQGPCLVRFLELRPGGPEAVLLLDLMNAHLFEQQPDGTWQRTAELPWGRDCGALRRAVEQEDIRSEAPLLPDLVIGGQRFSPRPLAQPDCQ